MNTAAILPLIDGVTEPVAYLTDVEIAAGSAQNGHYVTNDVVSATARFNKTVTVDDSAGTPTLGLTFGGPARTGDRTATYASGSGTTGLVFTYTIVAEDESSSHGIGTQLDPIALNGATITRESTAVQLERLARDGNGTRRVNYAPPVLSSAATASDGMSIVLTFDQALRTSTSLPNSQFSVTADGEPASLSTTLPTISGTTVTLSLTDTLIAANKVTVTYTDASPRDDSVGIQDTIGNDAESFTTTMVSNTVAADPPDAPTGLGATTTTARTVKLDWTAPTDTGSGVITGYQVEVSTDSASNWTVLEPDTGSTSTTYTDEGLTPETRYDYRVSAINADGVGAASGSINTTTEAVVTISSIAITSDPDTGGNTVDDDYYQGIPLLAGNQQQEIRVTVTFSTAVDVQTPRTSRGIALEIAGQTKLAAYKSGTGTTAVVYEYVVEPGLEDRDGVSFPANPLQGGGVVTKDEGAGFEVDGTHLAIADDAGHKVDSIAPVLLYGEANAGQRIFSFGFSEVVTYPGVSVAGIDPMTGDPVCCIDVSTANQRIRGATIEFDNPYPDIPGSRYVVYVTAYDAGYNPVSPAISEYAPATLSTVPSTPQNFAALPGNGRVTLTWDAPESDGGRAIDSYEYRYRETVDPLETANAWGAWTKVPDSGPDGANRSHYRVMDLTNGQGYEFELHAVNGIGSSAEAGAAGTPREPGAIRATFAIDPASPVGEDAGTVTVTVTAATNSPAPPDAPVELTVATADGTATAGEDYTALSQTVTFAVADFTLVSGDTHREASTKRTFTITDDIVDEGEDETFTIGLTATGDSADSVTPAPDLVVSITENDEAPGAPALSAEPGDAEVTLEWTAGTTGTAATIDGYDYRVSDSTGAPYTWNPDWTAIAGATSVTVNMHAGAALVNGTAYTFEVRARSSAGGGEEAQVSTTPGEVCGRTKAIADAITAAAAQSGCGDVTTTHLAAITELVKTGGNIPTLKSGDFAGLSGLTKLEIYNNAIRGIPADTFTGLTALQELNLGTSNFANGTLPAGVLSGLTALKRLYLASSNLRNPPPGLFSALSALEELDLAGNQMTTLPSGFFAGLASLKTLYIIDNQLSSLPAGTFSGLTNLISVWAQSNTAEPLPLNVTLEKVGEDGFQARVIEGAPFDIELPLTITGGTIDGGASSITVSKGSVTSNPLEVTRTAGSTDAVAVDIGTVPELPTDFDPNQGMTFGRYHQGYALVKAADLPLDVIRADLTTTVSLSIDPASPLAENVDTATVTVTAVTNRALAPEADVVVTVATADGTAMAGEDFEALSQTLTFAVADFTAVGTTHFEKSKNLTLTITDDALDDDAETFSIALSVSADATDPPTLGEALTITITDDDDAPGAPATLAAQGGFNEATLTWTAPASAGTSDIEGYDYRVSDETAEPYTWDPEWTAIPDSGSGGANATGYTVAMHTGAALVNGTTYTFEVRARSAAGGGEGTQATAAPNEVCGRTQQVREAIVAATPATHCSGVTAAHLAAITTLNLSGKSISSVKTGDFANLSALDTLQLFGNSLTTLPTGIFSGLTTLTKLELHVNKIETLPSGVFDDLTAVRTITMHSNRLTVLPANVFDNLTALRVLGVARNKLTSLGMDVFQHTTNLEALEISNNPIAELPAGLFSGTPGLRELYAHTMGLNALPAGLFSGLANLDLVWLHANPGGTFGLTVSLAKVGTDHVKATIAEGAPFDIVLPISPSGGTIEGNATTITIPTGAVESAPLEVTRGADPYVAVTVDIGSPLPVPPNSQASNVFDNDHRGYALAKASDLPLEIFPETPSTAINLSIEPAEVAEDAGATTLTVTAELDANALADDLVVTLTLGGTDDTATVTTDYTAGTVPALTITGGERSGTATLTFTPEDDSAQEGTETIALTGTVDLATLTVNAAELAIIDNDATPTAVTLAFTSDPDDSGPDDDTYTVGDVIEVTATFSAAITVSGTPQLELDVGGEPRQTECVLATDTTKLECTYTVADGDEDTDGVAIEANKLALNRGTITLGSDAVAPTHVGKSDQSAHLVDGLRPKLTDAATSADGTQVVLTYDQALSATTAPTSAFTVTVSSANVAPATPTISALAVNDATITLTIGTAVKAGQTVTVDYADPTTGNDTNAVQDAAGNDAAALSARAVTNTVPETATGAALSMALSSPTLTEGGAGVTVTVTIAAGATFATDRAVALAWGGEALAPDAGLVREPSGMSRVLVAAGESTGTTTLTGVERAAYTASTTKALTATFEGTQIESTDLTYADSGTKPTATIAATPATLAEGEDITVTVTLSRAVDEDVTATAAIGDTESVLTSTPAIASIPIAAYETTGTVTLSTTADMMTGADADVVFTLVGLDIAPYTLGTPETATVTVLDDTSASDEITLSVSPATVGEDAGATTLTVTATMNRAALTTATTVALAVTDGTATETTDYTATTASLAIAANARTGTATLTLTPVENSSAAADKTVTVGGTVTGFTVNGAEVTILDDDEPAITLTFPDGGTTNAPFLQVDEDDGTVTITLKAETAGTVAPTRDFDVRLRVVDTPDSSASSETGDIKPFDKTYTFAASDFTLASGQYSHTVSKDLEIIDDDTVEKPEKVFVGIDGDTLARHVTPANDALILIDDADTATTRFAQTSYEVDEGENIDLPITVDAPIGFPFPLVVATVELTDIGPNTVPADQRDAFRAELARATRFALDNEDYFSQVTVVEIEAFGTGGFTVRTIEDAIDEGTETLLVTMTGIGLDEDIIIFPKYAFIHIVDDDAAPGAPGLTATGGFNEATLAWTAPEMAGTATIDGYDYRVSDDDGTTWSPDWTAVPDSGAGGANETGYTVTMHAGAALVNGTTYTFEVRARSAAGLGAKARVTARASEVCGRTRQIADAIVEASPVSGCGDVTAVHLAAITELVKTGRDIPALKSGDFAGLSALTKLDLSDNLIPSVPSDIFSGLTNLEELNLAANDFRDSLPSGTFAGLTKLRNLNLFDAYLQTIPAGLFAGLGALEVLAVSNNRLTSLPAGLFANLSALRELEVSNNYLSSLPAGLLDGLTNLEAFFAWGNTVHPMPFTVALEKDGETGFRARVREGAPFGIVLPVTIEDGAIDGGATTLTVPTGTTVSPTVQVTRDAASKAPVIVDIGTLPALPTTQTSFGTLKHDGYALVKAADLPLEVIAEADSTVIGLSVDPGSVEEEGGGVTLTVTAMLDAAVRATATEVTLTVGQAGDSASATDDYATGTVPTLTIAANERSGTTTFTLTPQSDTIGEGDETVTIGGTVTVTELTVNAAQLTITDDDATPVPVTLAFTSDPDDAGPDDDTYAIGDVVEVTATFSGTITVTGGPPQLELDVGNAPKLAGCALGTDTATLECAYTVVQDDEDTDGIAIGANAIGLNGGSITLGGDAVTPTHVAKDGNALHKVDGVRPTLESAETSADGTKVVLTFDKSLSATTAPTSAFTVTVSTANTTATPSVTAAAADGLALTLTLGTAIKAGQTVTVGYADPTTGNDVNAAQDAVGNDAESFEDRAVENKVAEDATVATLTLALSSATLTEGGDPVTVTVSTASSATFATDQSVALAWGGGALASNTGLIRDATGRSAVVIAAGESSGTATLTGVERSAYTVSVTRALTATAGETQVGSENLTYADSGAAPAATIAATPATLTEGGDFTIIVTLSRAFDMADAAIALTMTDTESVVATTLPANGIIIEPGETTGELTLSTSADMMTGSDATVTLTLSTPGANAHYTLGTPSSASVTVYDDTSASNGITLSVSPASVAEGAGATPLTVTATVNRAAATTATSIALAVTADTATETTDYTAGTATLIIAANARTGTATLTLTPVDDPATEPDETVTIGGTVTGFTVIGAEVTILDDDEPAISLKFLETSGTPNNEFITIDEADGNLPVTLRAMTATGTMPTRDISVTVKVTEATARAEDGDFKPLDGTYTFAAADFTLDTDSGNYAHTVSKNLEIIDDLTVEKNENLALAVDATSLPRHVSAAPQLLVTITDTDTATIGFKANLHEVDEGEGADIELTLSAPVGFEVAIVVGAVPIEGFAIGGASSEQQAAFNAQRATFEYPAAQTDWGFAALSATIPPYARSFTTTVPTAEDTLDEEDETFAVQLIDNQLDASLSFDPIFAFVTILDDDELPDPPTGLTVDATTVKTVTLSWTAPDDTGGNPITGYQVEWADTATGPWTVATADTETGEDPETAAVETEYTHEEREPATSYHYRVSTITDTGTGEPSASLSATTEPLPVLTVEATNGVTTTTEGMGAHFTLKRAGDTSEALIVNLEWSEDGSEPSARTDNLDAGANGTLVVLTIRDNLVDEDDGSITLTLKEGDGYTIGTPDSATITVTDDDERPEPPVLTARPDDKKVELTWAKPTEGTQLISRYDYRHRESSETDWPDWVDTGADVSLASLLFIKTGLTNGTAYEFEVRAVSDAGEGDESNAASATPMAGPTITSIAITSTPSLCDARAYADTDEVLVTVTFSEAVTVDETGGTPNLVLKMDGTNTANAAYKSGSGTTKLVFTKTIANTDFSGAGEKSFAVDDPGTNSAGGLQLNGGTIRSAAMVNAVLTGMKLDRLDNQHMIGTIMTGATMTSTPASGSIYAIGEVLSMTADFEHSIGAIQMDDAKLKLVIGENEREASYGHFANNKAYFGYAIVEGDLDTDGVSVPTDALNLHGGLLGIPNSNIVNFIPCNDAVATLSSDTVDGVRPTLVTASPNEPRTSTDGTKVTLTFSETLSATTAAADAFTVMVSGMERSVNAVAIDDDDVNLTLGSAAGMMDTITVAYTDPTTDNDANAVQDAAGNDLVTFDAQAVTNNAPAGVTISSIALKDDAGVDDTHKTGDVVTATVTLSEAVGLTGTPHLELDVGGKARTALCALATDTTKLECTYTIVAGETDTDGIAIGANSLSLNGAVFTKASTDPGGLVLTHDAVAANSDNKVDAVLPTLVKMGTNRPHASSDGTKVILTFSETIGTVDRTKMTFKSGTTMLTTTADSKSGATVEITLMTALTTADTDVTVELDAAAVTDFAGNAIAAVDPTKVIVEDTTAPMLTDLTTPSPTEVLLTYDEELDSTSIPNRSRFDVKVGGTNRTVSSVAMSGTMGIALTVSPAFALGDTLTATYRGPGNSNPIQDIAENEAGAFTDRTVTNTLAAPGKPTSLAVGTETPTTIPLTWTAPDETGTDAISSYTLERAPDVSGSAGSWSTLWTGTETAYTDEGLAPETTYHYRVAATNSVGTGDASDATSGMTTAAPLVTIAVGPSADPKSTITEGDADNPAAIFTVTRTGDTSEPISVNVTLTQDGAYVAPADLGDVAVALATGASEATLTRTVIDDVLAEDNGSLSAELKARTTAGPYTLGTDTSATITIENEDTVPDAPSLTAIGHDTKLVLKWDKPAEGTSSITGYDYRYKETAGAESTWSAWADTGLSAANALNEFEVSGLTNGTQYTVEVTATSAAGTSLAGSDDGTPTPAPSVTSVEITSDPDIDKTYAIDDDIVVTVTFDKALTLGTGTGDPTLALTIGTATRTADCVLGTGATTLVCTYPVVEGDEAPSGLEIAANALTAGARTIVGPAPAEQTANLSHAVKTPDANHKVDGVKPSPGKRQRRRDNPHPRLGRTARHGSGARRIELHRRRRLRDRPDGEHRRARRAHRDADALRRRGHDEVVHPRLHETRSRGDPRQGRQLRRVLHRPVGVDHRPHLVVHRLRGHDPRRRNRPRHGDGDDHERELHPADGHHRRLRVGRNRDRRDRRAGELPRRSRRGHIGHDPRDGDGPHREPRAHRAQRRRLHPEDDRGADGDPGRERDRQRGSDVRQQRRPTHRHPGGLGERGQRGRHVHPDRDRDARLVDRANRPGDRNRHHRRAHRDPAHPARHRRRRDREDRDPHRRGEHGPERRGARRHLYRRRLRRRHLRARHPEGGNGERPRRRHPALGAERPRRSPRRPAGDAHLAGAGNDPRPGDHEVPVPPENGHRHGVRHRDRRPEQHRGDNRTHRERTHQRHDLSVRSARRQ